MCLLPGTLHASLCVGVSSLFDQGRLAGATYAGLYFIPVFLTKFMQIAHIIAASKSGVAPRWVDFCYYMSIDGLQIGLAKVILHTRGSTPFGAMSTNHRHDMNTSLSLINQPNGIAISAIFFGLCGLMVALAWSRVHAVEVVG
jgi:ABC-2 type transport system permease protein